MSEEEQAILLKSRPRINIESDASSSDWFASENFASKKSSSKNNLVFSQNSFRRRPSQFNIDFDPNMISSKSWDMQEELQIREQTIKKVRI